MSCRLGGFKEVVNESLRPGVVQPEMVCLTLGVPCDSVQICVASDGGVSHAPPMHHQRPTRLGITNAASMHHQRPTHLGITIRISPLCMHKIHPSHPPPPSSLISFHSPPHPTFEDGARPHLNAVVWNLAGDLDGRVEHVQGLLRWWNGGNCDIKHTSLHPTLIQKNSKLHASNKQTPIFLQKIQL